MATFTKVTDDHLHAFLENEKIEYANKYAAQFGLSETEKGALIAFFRECLEKKRLQRIKDITYDKDLGIIKDIPALAYNRPNNRFTLKYIDKQCITTLKSLTGKRKQQQQQQVVLGSARNLKVLPKTMVATDVLLLCKKEEEGEEDITQT
jgi:hypothetical protein